MEMFYLEVSWSIIAMNTTIGTIKMFKILYPGVLKCFLVLMMLKVILVHKN